VRESETERERVTQSTCVRKRNHVEKERGREGVESGWEEGGRRRGEIQFTERTAFAVV